MGRRVSVTADGTTTYFVYAGMNVVAETDSSGNLLRSYVHGPGIDNVLTMTDHTGTSDETYYYLKDHLGSVIALTDDTGAVVESYEYDAYGNVTVKNGSGTTIASSAYDNRHTFQGREQSWEIYAAMGGTGLLYFRARWYEPVTGRWLSKDPIGISGGWNQYRFCWDNPIVCIDPSGLWTLRFGVYLNMQVLFSGTADISIAFGHSKTEGWTLGVLISAAGGGGIVSGSAGGFAEWTNAPEVDALKGYGGQIGVTAGEGVVFGGDLVGGFRDDGSLKYWGITGTGGVGGGLPVDGHAQFTITEGWATDGKNPENCSGGGT